jgi:hypothetical protein
MNLTPLSLGEGLGVRPERRYRKQGTRYKYK